MTDIHSAVYTHTLYPVKRCILKRGGQNETEDRDGRKLSHPLFLVYSQSRQDRYLPSSPTSTHLTYLKQNTMLYNTTQHPTNNYLHLA